MLKELKRLCDEHTFCEIYTDTEDTSAFGVGCILARDDEFYIAWYVDKYGWDDGLSCALTENIYRVQTDTLYLKDMRKLMSHTGVTPNLKIDYKSDLLINFLKQIMTEQRICAIELCESDCDDIWGRVVNIDENNRVISLSMVNSRGQNDGISTVDIDMISEVYYKTRSTVRLEVLNCN